MLKQMTQVFLEDFIQLCCVVRNEGHRFSSSVAQNNKKGQHWFELVSRCTVVLLKCANHVGLLLSTHQDHDDMVGVCVY